MSVLAHVLYWPFIGAGVIALTLIINIFRAKRIDLKSVFVMVMPPREDFPGKGSWFIICYLINLLKLGIPTYYLFTN